MDALDIFQDRAVLTPFIIVPKVEIEILPIPLPSQPIWGVVWGLDCENSRGTTGCVGTGIGGCLLVRSFLQGRGQRGWHANLQVGKLQLGKHLSNVRLPIVHQTPFKVNGVFVG